MLLTGCKEPINSPHPLAEYGKNYRFSSFAITPKTLDPAQSATVEEQIFIAQIYEPPLQYHYLKRPYTLIPLTAQALPVVRYIDANGKILPNNAPAKQIAFTTYEIHIQPGIFFQPHPAFSRDKQGKYRYHALTSDQIKNIKNLDDFTEVGTRELTAEDYVYEIKRLAHPSLDSPILGLMSRYILGLEEYATQLRSIADKGKKLHKTEYIDLRKYPLEGAKTLDKYTYQITVKGQYRQFLYWLAMSYFAPIPWEADYFYSQSGMKERNINFDWYPVGTGAYLLAENNPNKEIILTRNPNFHTEFYPKEGEPTDKAAGYLRDAGKRLPFVDKFIFSLEKEAIPRWNKFLQGYYDQSGISEDNFGEAIRLDAKGNPQLTADLANKGINLLTSITPTSFFFGFNMLDSKVGGYTEPAKKLRQAISIAINIEEMITIFMNGRGIAAQGPIPPTIFGYILGKEGINPYVYNYVNGKVQRKPLSVARQLLAQAGYPNGRSIKTGKPLILRYDVTSLSPADKDQFEWFRKQFAKIGIELNVDSTDANRFQAKLRNGDAQIFFYGWVADYPDPENFLFLLYGPNGEVKFGGLNAANYQNKTFDALFNTMKGMENGTARLNIIQKMLNIVRADSPWVWGFYPKTFVLSHQWLYPIKPNPIAYNSLKYQRVNPELRLRLIQAWNLPIIWPLAILLLLVILVFLPAGIAYWRKVHNPISRS